MTLTGISTVGLAPTVLYGDGGGDRSFFGDSGSDSLFGDDGDDRLIYGGRGQDVLYGGKRG